MFKGALFASFIEKSVFGDTLRSTCAAILTWKYCNFLFTKQDYNEETILDEVLTTIDLLKVIDKQ